MQIQHELVLLDFWLSPFPENKQQAALEWISDIWYWSLGLTQVQCC